MKLNMVAYLIKEGITEGQVIDFEKDPERIEFHIKGVSTALYLKKSFSKPRWSDLFKDQNEFDPGYLL